MSREEAVARLLKIASERGEFAELEDGYVHWFPSAGGAISAWEAREIANELDRRNQVWDAVVNGTLPPPVLQVWRYEDAPEGFRELSPRDGDEDWLALVPPGMADVTGELWWMGWYPNDESRCHLRVVKHPTLPDLEIWIGSHA
jgi:hypothetical protein